MENGEILIITFGSFISTILICMCIRYLKSKKEELNEKNNVNRLVSNLRKKNIIKPLNCENEETKDEMENTIRITESVNYKENV